MQPSRARRTEQLTLAAEPELRAAIEREAERRDTSISSTIRALIRAQLASFASEVRDKTEERTARAAVSRPRRGWLRWFILIDTVVIVAVAVVLFITGAWETMSDEEKRNPPQAGGLSTASTQTAKA